MSAASVDSFGADADDHLGYGDPRLPSQPFDDESIHGLADSISVTSSSPQIYTSADRQGSLSESNGPILPPPMEMEPEEGFVLREWRRQNAIQLEEKEMWEKELVSQIRDEANEYKIEFHQRRKIICETNKVNNREKEKISLTNQEKFHAEADKNYWKAIAELIPHELPAAAVEEKKKRGKKPEMVVIQGPKPGKPTDLSRMRHILVKLKHSPPPHMKPPPPPKDGKTAAAALPKGTGGVIAAFSAEAVAVA